MLHKALGRAMAVWRDGAVVWIEPEDIVIDEEDGSCDAGGPPGSARATP